MIRKFAASIALVLAILPAQAQYAGLVGAVGTPTVTGCGSGASLASGSIDHIGTIDVGTGLVTSCSLNFSGTLAGTVRCTITVYGTLTPALTLSKTVTNSGFTATFVASIAGAQLDYNCFIN